MSLHTECLGTTFSAHLVATKNSFPQDMETMFHQVKHHCESTEFGNFCKRFGVQGTTFTWTDTSQIVKDRFLKACADNVDKDRSVALVFHGTTEYFVPSILSQGLDPRKRRGQAYGKGEYFGKDPGTSVGYCKQGKKMCVFLVIMPKNDEMYKTKPFSYVVVENNHHQLPIGSLTYTSVDQAVLSTSNSMRSRLKALNEEALQKEKEAKSNQIKAKIIQLIISREVEHAGQVYNRNKSMFDLKMRKEIAMYAYEGYDEDFVSFYFDGGLPTVKQGHANEEFFASDTRTVEDLEKDLASTRAKLQAETNGWNPSA